MAATPAARQVWAWPSKTEFGSVTTASLVLVAAVVAVAAPPLNGLIAGFACPQLPVLAMLSPFLLVVIAVFYKLWCSGSDMAAFRAWASRSVPADASVPHLSGTAQAAHPDLPASTTIHDLQGASGAHALGADSAIGKRARRRRRAGLCRRLRALLRRAWIRHCAASFYQLCEVERTGRAKYGHPLTAANEISIWKQVFWWTRQHTGRFAGNFVVRPPPHATSARCEYKERMDAVNRADFDRYDDERAAAQRAQRARVAAMDTAQFSSYMAEQDDRRNRRLVAASVRDAVADANPKHAEFIQDSPLAWYADGPIDDVMADWEDEEGLGDLGWGEGLGEDGDWDWEGGVDHM